MRCVCGGGCGERCGVCVFMVKQLVNFIHKKFDIHMLINIHQMFMWGMLTVSRQNLLQTHALQCKPA